MNVESFLDYNQILKVIFEITGERVDYDFICSTKDERLSDSIIENLKNISSLEENGRLNICRQGNNIKIAHAIQAQNKMLFNCFLTSNLNNFIPLTP